MKRSNVVALSTLAMMLAAGGAAAQPQPERSPRPRGPQSSQPDTPPAPLPVPEEAKKLGTVYYTITGKERQISFESKAPREEIQGHSKGVVGYAVAGDKDKPAALKAGEWRLAVSSIRTGIPARDVHLTQANWLDAGSYPNITFKLSEVKDIAPDKDNKDKYSVTLVGDMTIHGVTKPLSIPGSTITFLAASAETEKVAAGNLMRITAKYPITIADFGVKNQVIGQKVAETINVTTDLVLSTVDPRELKPEKPATPAPKATGE